MGCGTRFIDGEDYVTPAPSLRHQDLVGRLYLAFGNSFRLIQGRCGAPGGAAQKVMAAVTTPSTDVSATTDTQRALVFTLVGGAALVNSVRILVVGITVGGSPAAMVGPPRSTPRTGWRY